ncbi:CHAP domain-containing protein [Acinetobacter halotolerans]|uniref:CHAP domain-containing protein n=2 Tax=Acinetobacter halotolerans TaxID=1752076 RepID=A0A4Q6XH52_9GAMM|nr:CHAP domain-containing protein [Acinetobacter halotolerans]RZF50223.1 CHAP domain-containing protein [Acinetobacter halotolerans]
MIYDAPSVDHSMVHTPPHQMIVTTKDVPKQPSLDVMAFAQKLTRRASYRSSAQCAKFVRIALQSAGAKIVNHPVAASDWGKTLQEIGYKKITPAFDQPQKGDIYIIHRTKKHRYGHIAGFSGTQWISDFKQRSHDIYKDKNVTYSYYRLSSNYI